MNLNEKKQTLIKARISIGTRSDRIIQINNILGKSK